MSSTRRRLSLSIRTAVALATALPLITLALITYGSLESADRQRERASDVSARTDDIVTLIALESELTIESYWAGAAVALSSYGVTPELVSRFLGTDISLELQTASDAVDRRLRSPLVQPFDRSDDVVALVADGRERAASGQRLGDEVAAPYTRAAALVSEEISIRLRTVDDMASALDDGGRLARGVTDLALAAETRESFLDMASYFFAVRFPDQTTQLGLKYDLTAAYAFYIENSERIRRDIAGGAGMLEQIDADPAVAEFLAEVRVAIDDIIAGTETALAGRDVATEFPLFIGSIEGVGLHIDLVDRAALALRSTAADVVADAGARRGQVWLQAILAIIAGVMMVAIARRWIIHPLRSIADRATRILDGDLDRYEVSNGLREIRDAELALNAAANNIQLAERQALALADADLDAEVLTVQPRGRLDAALRSAFDQLRRSIADREEYRERLRYEAEHDALTGLPNRSAILWQLERSLAHAAGERSHIAVLFIDLDRFKRINDQQGHAAGDLVLREVARRISGTVRDTDHVGRLAGDEFVVVTDVISSTGEAIEIAQRIRDAFVDPMQIGSASLTQVVSVGIAVSSGELDADEMLRDADLAVYRAKSDGSSGVELCDAVLRAEFAHRTSVEARLRDVLGRDELELHYQPIVDGETETITALEALLRWTGPNAMSPAEFIPIAERSDLIIEVDRWVIDRAARQLAEWSDHPVFGRVPVAINVSARHISGADLAGTALSALAEHGIASHRMMIEVTESALLADVDHAAGELARLRQQGVRVAIDDFGTGHTSLSHLRELPIDVLKLDREFVVAAAEGRDRPLAKLIVDAGHLVGATVVAEGVETVEQLMLMRELGADEIQGFIYSRPMPPDQVPTDVAAEATPLPPVRLGSSSPA